MIEKPPAYRSVADLCRALGWARTTVDYNIWVSRAIPQPIHTRGRGRRYYTEAEVLEIVEMMKELKGTPEK